MSRGRAQRYFLNWQECRTKQNRPRGQSRSAFYADSKRSVFGSRRRNRRLRWHFRLRAAQPPEGVGANAPEDCELRGLGFLGLAVLALILRADELSVNKDMVGLVERVRDGLAEAVERHDAIPLGSGLPLVVRVLPRLPERVLTNDRGQAKNLFPKFSISFDVNLCPGRITINALCKNTPSQLLWYFHLDSQSSA